MKTRPSIFGVVVALLLLLPAPAKATPFLYTISFDEMTINGLLYPADSFSFSVPSIITSFDVITMPIGTELNGIPLPWLGITPVSTTLAFGYSLGSNSGWTISFTPDTFPGAVGSYLSTNDAIYVEQWPCLGCGTLSASYHGSGTLSIADAETSTVPDTGSTLLLLGIGLAGLRAWRKR